MPRNAVTLKLAKVGYNGRRRRFMGGVKAARATILTNRRLAPPRSGGFWGVQQRVRGNELNTIDVNSASYVADTTGTVTLLNGVATGDDFTDRTGRKIVMKSIYIRGLVKFIDTSSGPTLCRLIIIYDNQTNGAAPVMTDMTNRPMPADQLPTPVQFTQQRAQLLVKKEMFEHLAIMLAGASAPLMRFTGIYGMTYHCGSTESGTGKSLALEAAASVWGHPVHYRTGKSTSPVAMQQRLGLLNSHPLITDELTSKNRANFEWLPEFLLDMTEGRGKERMESGANKERINLSTWMTCAIMSSNTHVVDGLTGGRKHSSEGELRRLLEFILTKTCEWEPHEIEVIKSLQHNYAVAGHMMAEYLV